VPNYYVILTYGGVEARCREYLTSEQDEYEGPALHFARFISRESILITAGYKSESPLESLWTRWQTSLPGIEPWSCSQQPATLLTDLA
jgi:hypothetical protein